MTLFIGITMLLVFVVWTARTGPGNDYKLDGFLKFTLGMWGCMYTASAILEYDTLIGEKVFDMQFAKTLGLSLAILLVCELVVLFYRKRRGLNQLRDKPLKNS